MLIKLNIAGLLMFLLVACSNDSSSNAIDLDRIIEAGELIIVTRNAPTTWYIDSDGQPSGYEYELAQHYAEALGVTTKFLIKDNIEQLFDALETGQAHVAAAGLTVLDSRQEMFLIGPVYNTVNQQLVCHRDGPKPSSFEALADVGITVISQSSYSHRLAEISTTLNAPLIWQETDDYSTEELLEKVADNKLDCTIADSTIVKINRRIFPELVVTMDLTPSQDIALFIAPSLNALQKKLKHWFKSFKSSTAMREINDKYVGFFPQFDYVDIITFTQRIDQRLPRFENMFERAAKTYQLPLTTLMAQSYQESHWEPDAVSPTGVKGIMMLTKNTAKEMAVKNRLDAKQSIMGGARYLSEMRDRFAPEVDDENRLLLALAAYNVGRAHMHDAQILARKLNKSPYHWHDMKTVLPLLSQKKYYKQLKYGYARGTEPVRYVQRIREYQHILDQQFN